MADVPAKPSPRPKPQLIDKSKFLGGTNVEKLKGILKDADKFAEDAKVRLKEAGEVFDRLRNTCAKFDETVTMMGEMVNLNTKAFDLMIKQMTDAINGATKGD